MSERFTITLNVDTFGTYKIVTVHEVSFLQGVATSISWDLVERSQAVSLSQGSPHSFVATGHKNFLA